MSKPYSSTWWPIEKPDTLLLPLKRFIKVKSLLVENDLFADDVTDEQRDQVLAVAALSPHVVFQILTKRPELMLAYLKDKNRAMRRWGFCAAQILHRISDPDGRDYDRATAVSCVAECREPAWPLPNVWLGVTVENQQAADERIPLLLQTPAAVRFLSCESLLGPVHLTRVDWVEEMKRSYRENAEHCKDSTLESMMRDLLATVEACKWEEGRAWRNVLTGSWYDGWDGDDSPEPEHTCIDWVIAGGESGKAKTVRPSHPDWVRVLRDQCAAAGVPFFFTNIQKQVGTDARKEKKDGSSMARS